jgi:hypothetical protein
LQVRWIGHGGVYVDNAPKRQLSLPCLVINQSSIDNSLADECGSLFSNFLLDFNLKTCETRSVDPQRKSC